MNRYRHDPDAPSHLRRLMESARGDELDARRRRRVAERLGLMPMTIPPAKADLEPIQRSSSLVYIGTITIAALALFGGGAGFVEWMGAGAGAGAGPAPARAASTSAEPAATSVEPSSVVMPVSTSHADSVLVPAPTPVGVASMDVAALPDVRQERVAKPSRAPTPVAESTKADGDSSTLRLEIIALDEARRETEAGRPRAALTRLDEYATKFPRGMLREEAMVLRIEALHASGDHATAGSLARRLFRDSPKTPYAARVRAGLVNPSRE